VESQRRQNSCAFQHKKLGILRLEVIQYAHHISVYV
jgi:hypothetical protein